VPRLPRGLARDRAGEPVVTVNHSVWLARRDEAHRGGGQLVEMFVQIERRQILGRADVEPRDRATRPERFRERLDRRIAPRQIVDVPARADEIAAEVEHEQMPAPEPRPPRRIERIVGETEQEHPAARRRR